MYFVYSAVKLFATLLLLFQETVLLFHSLSVCRLRLVVSGQWSVVSGPLFLILFCALGATLTGCRSTSPRAGFFPLGIYAPGSTNNFQEIRSAGFNLVTGPADDLFLQAAGSHQLQVLASIPKDYGPLPIVPSNHRMMGPQTTDHGPAKYGSTEPPSTIGLQDSNPNLWAWFVVDEPDLNRISPAAVAEANCSVKRFGHKPTALVLYSGSQALDYASIPDILMIDRYPVPWLPLANFAQHVRLARFAAGPQKPLITVIQAFDWSYHPELVDHRPNLRVPTYDEIRCMTYSALAEGANGLFYYAYDDGKWRMGDHPATWIALRKVAAEINLRLPLFTARHPWSGVYVTYEDWASGWNEALNSSVNTTLLEVRVGNTTVKQGRYLLSVNTTARQLNYQVHLPLMLETITISVLEENRKVLAKAGVFPDDIAPYAVHVYGPF